MHTRARTFRQRFDEAAGDLALLKNVSFEIDAMLRLPYSVEFSFIKALAVSEHLDAVGGMDLRIGERREHALKVCGIGRRG